ncbi:hypothetical protein [Geodermatophilus amargosae]|uniref:hypothetical protein n=1 Tax=Geodermatophilus amargosae TaxID=1296565 RepID=UPI001114D5D4|nr:hypothetical protein [Geodermatophilus amargosae]
MTHSLTIFTKTVNRSRAFLRIFDSHRGGPGRPSADEKELLRGALVFAVGALDAYLSDLIIEVVPGRSLASQPFREALKAIAKSDPGLALRVSLAGSPEASQDEFRVALTEWLDTKSWHGPTGVASALGFLACPVPWRDFDTVTGLDTAKELDRITTDRHDIVHRGGTPYIKRALAEESVTLVEGIARHVDKEVVAQFSLAKAS